MGLEDLKNPLTVFHSSSELHGFFLESRKTREDSSQRKFSKHALNKLAKKKPTHNRKSNHNRISNPKKSMLNKVLF